MKLIVGLGNPGKRYVNNRHNVGFRCINYFARKHGIRLSYRRSRSRLGIGTVEGTKVILAKPGTYMNASGEAVAALMRHYKLSPEDLLVIYDDLDLPLGKIRIRERGSSGGHKGMRSIISCLGRQEFPRIRIGISAQESETENFSDTNDTIHYVLGDFTGEEKAIIRKTCSAVAEAIHCIITRDIATAMNKFNRSS